jgi:RNA polymerase sporulation-specific sigma factor
MARSKLVNSKNNFKKVIKDVVINESIIGQEEPKVDEDDEIKVKEPREHKDILEQILFKVPCVSDPFIGTPKQVQKELDALAKKMQRDPEDESIFNKIHLYMHGYLINIVLKKFPFIKGYQTVDIYQETLIALRFKAIPKFKTGKGMSFLNFAKMCIRRHLITILNTSRKRKRDQSMNTAISLDSCPLSRNDDENGEGTFANIIPDSKICTDKVIENNEAYAITKKTLMSGLSEFEQVVLKEYLSTSSYREISKNISNVLSQKYNTKSIDNALLRIRKKAMLLKKANKLETIPMFITKR